MRGLYDDNSVGDEISNGLDEARKMLEISGKIQEIAAEQYQGAGMPVGDYQGAIEAQVMIAIQYGMMIGSKKAL